MGRNTKTDSVPPMTKREASIAYQSLLGHLLTTTMERAYGADGSLFWVDPSPGGQEQLDFRERLVDLRAQRLGEGVPLVEILDEARALCASTRNVFGRTYAQVIGLDR